VNDYLHYTPMTDTTELATRFRGLPLEDQPTTEVAWWHPKPEVMATARYERAPLFPRLRSALAGIGVVFGCLALSAVPSTPMDAPVVEVQR